MQVVHINFDQPVVQIKRSFIKQFKKDMKAIKAFSKQFLQNNRDYNGQFPGFTA